MSNLARAVNNLTACLGEYHMRPDIQRLLTELADAILAEARKPQPAPTPQVAAPPGPEHGLLKWCMTELERCQDPTESAPFQRAGWRGGTVALRAVVQEIHRRWALGPSPWVDPTIGLPALTPEPPAATPARERLRKAVDVAGESDELTTPEEFDELVDAAEAVLNEPAAADGAALQVLRELQGWLRGYRVEANEGEGFILGAASLHNDIRVEIQDKIDRLLSRSPAAQAKDAT